MFISEDDIEQAALKLLEESYKEYSVLHCYTHKREALPDSTGRTSKKQVILPAVLFESVCRINPDIPKETIQSVCEELGHIPVNEDLMQVNWKCYQKIREGITVTYKKDGKSTTDKLHLIDFNNPSNNSFIAASQVWIQGKVYWRRPDIIIFINGLPLVFIELKNSNINVKNAYDKNLQDYLNDIPYLFAYNQICVLSNAMETRMGSFLAGYEYFFEWLKVKDEKENPDRKVIHQEGTSLEYFLNGLAKPEVLIDYIENFILYNRRDVKIIAKNHQFFGVNNAYDAFLHRSERHGKLGVFWHTQGSGKSYSMVMLTRKIKRKCEGNFTFLVVTDREELDGQIYKNFLRTEVVGEKEKVQPANSRALRAALQTNASILFTLIHKFRFDKGKDYPILSERDDIIVMVDEAHRTQYKDLAENMRNGLPNAQYIAFTGTPLLGSKKLTKSWFGDYVSEYNFAESVRDNATVPLYYYKDVPEVQLTNEYLDPDFMEIITEDNLTEAEQERLENHYAKELEVIRREDRIDEIAQKIVKHFPYRGFLGKGLVISIDKFTTVRMYNKVQHYWHEEIKNLNKLIMQTSDKTERNRLRRIVEYMNHVEMAVVVSEEAKEDEKFKAQGLSIKEHRERMNFIDENGDDIEDNFKNPDHPLQLVFVCSMWLTGFDAPSISSLYLDKPMKNHTLMQTIARANRVFPGKNNGIIVDYIDIFGHLKKALADYASEDEDDTPVRNLNFLFEQLGETIELTVEFCRSHGVELQQVLGRKETFKDISLFGEFADKLIKNDDIRNEYRVYANLVDTLYESLKPEIFQMDFNPNCKDAILYLEGIIEGKVRPDKLQKAEKKINALLDQSVVTSEKKEIDYAANRKEIDLSKLNIEELRNEIRKMPYKNLEIANLREHIEVKIKQMLERNVTRTNFAERFKRIIDDYNAGGSENDDFYEKLLQFMEELREEESRHIREELSEEELELFDLLQKDKLNKKEEKQVKLAAKKLYGTLIEKQQDLFIVGWQDDPQPKERVKNTIVQVLNEALPDSYDRDIFALKSNLIFDHIVDQAMMGYAWMGGSYDSRMVAETNNAQN